MVAARDFVECMTVPVWQAMAAVRLLEGRVANRPKADANSPAKAALTDADCVSQEILLTALRAHFPEVEIDAEEETAAAARFASNRSDYTVVIDPIDGTLRYLRQDGLYAILVGLEHRGRAEGALVGLPQLGLLLRAVRGGGAEIASHGGRFGRAAISKAGSRALVSWGIGPDVEQRLRDRGLELETAAGAALGVAPLLEGVVGGVRIVSDPNGLSRRTWIALLVSLEAGCKVEALSGVFPERFETGLRGMVVAATDAELARLSGAVR